MIQRLLLTLALTVVVLLAPGGASARPGDSSSPSARAPVTTVVDTTLPGPCASELSETPLLSSFPCTG